MTFHQSIKIQIQTKHKLFLTNTVLHNLAWKVLQASQLSHVCTQRPRRAGGGGGSKPPDTSQTRDKPATHTIRPGQHAERRPGPHTGHWAAWRLRRSLRSVFNDHHRARVSHQVTEAIFMYSPSWTWCGYVESKVAGQCKMNAESLQFWQQKRSLGINLHPQAFSVFCNYWIFCGTEMPEHSHTVCLCVK